MSLKSVIVNPKAQHTATVFFLHGLGDTGFGWQPVGEMLSPKLPHVKWVFPHAPQRPVTLNGGMMMPAWYDIKELLAGVNEDEAGLLDTAKKVHEMIRAEIDSGIPADRIILGGFSQGAASTIVAGLTSDVKLAGLVVLSGYAPLSHKIGQLKKNVNDATPIFAAHGMLDQVVKYEWGQMSAGALKHRFNLNLEFKTYHDMGHSTDPQELVDLAEFIKKTLP
ncbi:hypothetical protein HK105_204580 [Polyrhizophydium stewartii]|uniref:Acyl-protein thioesterase 1 n=1 Tax=Polyrhizophydium stewartii TaxID=2732419 RepID=A0ABR4N8M9_9FUNG